MKRCAAAHICSQDLPASEYYSGFLPGVPVPDNFAGEADVDSEQPRLRSQATEKGRPSALQYGSSITIDSV